MYYERSRRECGVEGRVFSFFCFVRSGGNNLSSRARRGIQGGH